jgi:hypothetical protein
MNVFSEIELQSAELARFVEGRAAALEAQCREIGVQPKDARLVVMWGGGKDSTLAVILTKAVSSLLGCSAFAATMAHPGLSRGTVANIDAIAKRLELTHQWRQFVHVVSGPHTANEDWLRLYRTLALATEFQPRFMCVACNFGSIVVEFQALSDLKANFRVTGNPPAELLRFEDWMAALRVQFATTVAFPQRVGRPMLDYFRSWWAVYDALLTELSGLARSQPEFSDVYLEPKDYLFSFPPEDDLVGRIGVFSVLEDENVSYVPADYRELLTSFGWQLPDDIQGGTESDCMMPAAIAALDIERSGIDVYMEHLAHTASVLKPLPEMYDRARSWATSGRSSVEGEKLLGQMGIPHPSKRSVAHGTPIAKALAGQLLPVR